MLIDESFSKKSLIHLECHKYFADFQQNVNDKIDLVLNNCFVILHVWIVICAVNEWANHKNVGHKIIINLNAFNVIIHAIDAIEWFNQMNSSLKLIQIWNFICNVFHVNCVVRYYRKEIDFQLSMVELFVQNTIKSLIISQSIHIQIHLHKHLHHILIHIQIHNHQGVEEGDEERNVIYERTTIDGKTMKMKIK